MNFYDTLSLGMKRGHSPGSLGKQHPPVRCTPRLETMNDLLSLPEAAIRLGRSWQSTYGLALQGKLGPLQKFNRSYAISVQGVEAFLEHERAQKQARSAVAK